MSTTVDNRLGNLLEEAARRNRWLVPHSHADQLALRRRVGEGGIVMPYKNCFANASRANDLGVRGRALVTILTLADLHPG